MLALMPSTNCMATKLHTVSEVGGCSGHIDLSSCGRWHLEWVVVTWEREN